MVLMLEWSHYQVQIERKYLKTGPKLNGCCDGNGRRIVEVIAL